MAYLTYTEYQQYGGTVDEASFINSERKARRWLDAHTQNRIPYMTSITEEVKECMTELINLFDEDGGQTLTSFSNGKVSMTFDSSKNAEKRAEEIICVYLPVSLISGVISYED